MLPADRWPPTHCYQPTYLVSALLFLLAGGDGAEGAAHLAPRRSQHSSLFKVCSYNITTRHPFMVVYQQTLLTECSIPSGPIRRHKYRCFAESTPFHVPLVDATFQGNRLPSAMTRIEPSGFVGYGYDVAVEAFVSAALPTE